MSNLDDPLTHPEDSPRVDPAPPPPQAPRVHLILGPVGAGKSTFARELARERGAVRLTLDAWMATLFSDDRPTEGLREWYVERARRAVEQIWAVTLELLDRRVEVVLEIGLITRAERERFYERVRQANVSLCLHWLDAPREVRRERVARRNRDRGETFSNVVPEAIFELASNLWEAPDEEELAQWDGHGVIGYCKVRPRCRAGTNTPSRA